MTPLALAQQQLAAGVSSIGGRFHGPPQDLFSLPEEAPLAWCARMQRANFAKCGHPLPGNPYEIGSVAALHDALVAAGMFFEFGDKDVEPGDLILLLGTAGNRDGMIIGGHHVAIVESIDYVAGTVTSIDGDWGTPDRVQKVVRNLDADDIWGYARVPGASGHLARNLIIGGTLVSAAAAAVVAVRVHCRRRCRARVSAP